MDFWDQFLKESLQSPWVIQPLGRAAPRSIRAAKIFVVSNLSEEDRVMVHKMIGALKWDSSKVEVFEWKDESDGMVLEELQESKDILFFGENFPGNFGYFENWQGHRVLLTHSIETLQSQPEFKKETWAHLQEFSRI